MVELFDNNLIAIYLISVFYIFSSSTIKSQKYKIIYNYILLILILHFTDINVLGAIIVFLTVSFFYFEFLIDDEVRIRYLSSKVFYRLIDYLYLIIIKYKFPCFCLLMLLMTSEIYLIMDAIFFNSFLLDIFFSILLVVFIYKFFDFLIVKTFQEKDFNYIIKALDDCRNTYKKVSEDKKNMLIDFEDKSFYIRKNDYTFLCLDFFKYRFARIDEFIMKTANTDIKTGRFSFRYIQKVISYIGKIVLDVFKDLFRKSFRISIRGCSTIDMQLARTLGSKENYEDIFTRKFFEYIYTQIIFKNYKKNRKIKDKEMKDLIIYTYLKYAEVTLIRKYNNIKEFWGQNINDLSNEQFFITVLSLSNRLNTIDKLNFDFIYENFEIKIKQYNLDVNKLKIAIAEAIKIVNI